MVETDAHQLGWHYKVEYVIRKTNHAIAWRAKARRKPHAHMGGIKEGEIMSSNIFPRLLSRNDDDNLTSGDFAFFLGKKQYKTFSHILQCDCQSGSTQERFNASIRLVDAQDIQPHYQQRSRRRGGSGSKASMAITFGVLNRTLQKHLYMTLPTNPELFAECIPLISNFLWVSIENVIKEIGKAKFEKKNIKFLCKGYVLRYEVKEKNQKSFNRYRQAENSTAEKFHAVLVILLFKPYIMGRKL